MIPLRHNEAETMDLQTAKQSVPRAAPTWKVVTVFYGIACGISWMLWLPLVLGPQGLRVTSASLPFPVVVSAGTLGPLLACFIVHHRYFGNWRAVRLIPARLRDWIWLVLGPLLILFSRVFVFSALFTKGGPAAWQWHIDALAGIWVPILNYNLFGGPLFEEFGWRGFLQSYLQRSLPAWSAAVLTGILWACWHLPLIFVGWSGVSFPVFLAIMVSVSLIIAFAFNGSKESIVVAILMHSTFNAANRFLPAFLGNVATREHPSEGVFLALSFFLVAFILAISTRGRMLAP